MFNKLICSIAIVMLPSIAGGVQALTITTADGRGADTYLTNDSSQSPNTNTSAEVRMRAFRQLANTRSKTGYIRFDLGDAVGDMSGATLTLEATFLKGSAKVVQVYGLIDGDGDSWDESTITYNTAPGMLPRYSWQLCPRHGQGDIAGNNCYSCCSESCCISCHFQFEPNGSSADKLSRR